MILRDRDANANPADGLEQRHYVQHDANFNVTAITDPTGTVVERYLTTPTAKPPSWLPTGNPQPPTMPGNTSTRAAATTQPPPSTTSATATTHPNWGAGSSRIRWAMWMAFTCTNRSATLPQVESIQRDWNGR